MEHWSHIGLAALFISIMHLFGFINLSSLNILLAAGIIVIYALLPDIDQQGSIINNIINVVLCAFVLYSIVYHLSTMYTIMAIVIIILLQIIHHRTLIHSLIAAVVFSLPLFFLGTTYVIIGIISYLSHLIGDNDVALIGWKKR